MRPLSVLAFGLVIVAATAGCGPRAGTLEAAREALGATTLQSIEYSGTGRWFQFGQAPNPTLPWPAFEVSRFTAAVDYQQPAARVEMTRRQIVEPGRVRPAPAEQRAIQVVSGTFAWNLPAAPAGAAAGAAPAPAPTPQPAAVEERTMEIWTTPHGFLKAAAANNATSTPAGEGSEVAFTIDGKYKYVGRINAQNEVERVQTFIDNTVLGDTPVEITYSDYRDFEGVRFPSRIVRTQGGHPVLDLTIEKVALNPTVQAEVPEQVRVFTPPAVNVVMEPLATGVHYVRGGSHHSVAIEQRDHVVVVEAPQDEARSEAVIAKVKETIPGKPIRYIVNSHVHFDHSGGLRTYVAEGATVVTHEMNRSYYEKAWAEPRTIRQDRLARAPRTVTFETFTDKHVLGDGKRQIEVHRIAGSGHNDAYAMVYLPAERILIQVDAYAPLAPNAPPPAAVNPFTVNLLENVDRLKLPVRTIAALHGPGVATIDDLRAAARPPKAVSQ
jgi:glyoxylase-like metal-dependent hydrolase (beta-lactamase superfamily II)